MWLVVVPVLPCISVQSPHWPPDCFCRYCHLVMVEPTGAVQVSVAVVPAKVAVKPVGLPGVARGVADASADWAPLPPAVAARMRKP